MKITLLGKPISTGSIYRYACRGNFPCMYMTKAGKELKDDYVRQAREQYTSEPLKCPLRVVITTYHGRKGKLDWDNFHKISMDALTGIVYEDDSQIEAAQVFKKYDKDSPRIEIIIDTI